MQTKDIYVIITFFENIVKNTLDGPRNLAENLLENPGKEFHFYCWPPWFTPYCNYFQKEEIDLNCSINLKQLWPNLYWRIFN